MLKRLGEGYERVVSAATRSTWVSILLIFALGVSVRALYVVLLVGLNSPPTYDGIGYDILATKLLETGMYGDGSPTAFRPPGYPLFLAGVYLTFGHSYAAVRAVQIVADALTCVLVFALGTRLMTRRVAFLGAVAVALYPLQVYMVGEFYSETLSFLLQVIALCLAAWMLGHKQWVWALLLGVSLAATALTRPTAVLWLPLMLLWIMILPWRWACKIRQCALVVLGLALLFAPWVIRNYVVFREIIPIASLGGVGIWAGNNPMSEGGGMLPSQETWGEGAPEYGWMGWEGLTEAQSSQRFTQRGLAWIKQNPLAFAALVPRKIIRLWSPTSFGVQFSRHASPLLTAVVVPPYLVFLGLAFAGMVLSRRGWRAQFPLYALILGTNALVALTYGATRYGIAMACVLCLYAAVAVDAIGRRFCAQTGRAGD